MWLNIFSLLSNSRNFYHGFRVIVIIIIMLQTCKRMSFFKVGPKEYFEGEDLCKIVRWLQDFVILLSQFRHGFGLKQKVI